METSLARRQRHRRNGNGHRRGSGAASKIAIAVPLFLFGTFLLVGLIGFVVAVSAYTVYSQGLDDPKKLLDSLTFDQQTVVYDSTGKVELARFGQQKRVVVKFNDIPRTLIDATTSIEDKTFWDNAGFDPLAIVRAAAGSLRGNAGGASTITQQLVRARLLPDSVLQGSNVDRKIKEIIQSIRLTEAFPGDEGKRRIMEYYLNQNFYGNQSYGVAAAAKSYFGVSDLKKLTLAQAAILAAIPQSPTQYDLVKNADEQTDASGRTILVVPPDSAIVIRRNLVLDRMVTNRVLTAAGQVGAITDAQLEAAKKEPVILVPQAQASWRAPHFVWQVRKELGERLCPQDPGNCDKVDTGGYKIITTLDWKMQQTAEKWIAAAVLGPNANDTALFLKSRGVTNADWITNLRGKNIHNGAMLAIDYRTGQILAYVGSASYYSATKSKLFQPQFDVLADGWRQPGSAMKPINYIIGFEDRTITPATMFMDVATDFGGGYVPTDADNLERGPLRMRQALQFSLNIPAVKAAIINTPEHVIDVSKRFGLTFPQGVNPGASIALGTLEVHPREFVAAYGAIANGGVLMPQTTIVSIADARGAQIYPAKGAKVKGTTVVSPQSAFLMSDILSGNTVPSINPYWGKFEITANGRHVNAALKTGTTNDTKDLSAYGFLAPPDDPNAPGIAIGVWMGNSDNSRTKGVFSLESTAPLYQSFLNEIVKTHPAGSFKEPPKIVHAKVDAWTGLLPGPFTTNTVDEIFIDGTVPTKRDDTKVGIDVDAATGKLWAEGCTGPKETRGFLDLSGVDAGFPAWQKADQDWIGRARHGPGVRGGPAKGIKTATSYFYQGGFQHYGASWGAPFPPTETCTPVPSPTPSGFGECPPGGVQLNPDGTIALDQNGQPIPCPTAPPPSTVCQPGEIVLNPDGTPVLDQNGQPIPCPTPQPTEVPTETPQPARPTRPPGPTPEPTVPQASI
jgi:membrane peptidoglycan carboxypeptidase